MSKSTLPSGLKIKIQTGLSTNSLVIISSHTSSLVCFHKYGFYQLSNIFFLLHWKGVTIHHRLRLCQVFCAYSNPLAVLDKLHRRSPIRSPPYQEGDLGSASFQCSLCYKAQIRQILLILIPPQHYSPCADRLLIWLESSSCTLPPKQNLLVAVNRISSYCLDMRRQFLAAVVS